ncbi:MAG: 50S ribosomal protein L11 [Candidatus Poribacteria bacterium]|nr:50S ribosomal protein L11 [Candidatus Poribacteria bacterium]
MAKKILTTVNLQLPCGAATPAPPVGPSLAPTGINMGEFIKNFNAQTASQAGTVVSAVVTVYADRSFDMQIKTPLVTGLLKKAAQIESAAAEPGRESVGSVTRQQILEIAQVKLPDLNTKDIEAAARIVEGTARSMGINIDG